MFSGHSLIVAIPDWQMIYSEQFWGFGNVPNAAPHLGSSCAALSRKTKFKIAKVQIPYIKRTNNWIRTRIFFASTIHISWIITRWNFLIKYKSSITLAENYHIVPAIEKLITISGMRKLTSRCWTLQWLSFSPRWKIQVWIMTNCKFKSWQFL